MAECSPCPPHFWSGHKVPLITMKSHPMSWTKMETIERLGSRRDLSDSQKARHERIPIWPQCWIAKSMSYFPAFDARGNSVAYNKRSSIFDKYMHSTRTYSHSSLATARPAQPMANDAETNPSATCPWAEPRDEQSEVMGMFVVHQVHIYVLDVHTPLCKGWKISVAQHEPAAPL